MSTPLQVYQRILQLPCDDLRSGRGIKDTLDLSLKQLIGTVFCPERGFKVQYGSDDNGQLEATISRGVHKIQLQGRYGQNTVFSGEKKSSFISYTIRAEGTLSTLNRAENSRRPVMFGRVAGATVLAAVAVIVLWMSRMEGHRVPAIICALLAGQWLGGKVAQRIAQQLEARAEDRTVDIQELERAKAVWTVFTSNVTEITSAYRAVK